MKIVGFNPYGEAEASVIGYLHTPITEMQGHRKQFPSIVICPGGGYEICSQREADPVAFEFFARGYNVFVLQYSLGEQAKDFNPLKELSSTLIYIRNHKLELGCIEDQIAVMGFSAGGHLAASLGTLWNHDRFLKVFDNAEGKNKPNAMVLSYPVITASDLAHQGSIERVSGGDADLRKLFSLENQVTSATPPTFIWHTVDDTVVPVENSIYFVRALQEAKVPFECHLFPTGPHGISVCTEEVGNKDTYVGQWVELCATYLGQLFDHVK